MIYPTRYLAALERVNQMVNDNGVKSLAENQTYNDILKCIIVSIENIDDGFSVIRKDSHIRLFKKINGKVEYITLLFSDSDDDVINSDFYWYESKSDMDSCEALIAIKRHVRSILSGKRSGYWIS